MYLNKINYTGINNIDFYHFFFYLDILSYIGYFIPGYFVPIPYIIV
jgi:hypothetical protein